jgi:hypothetical protein
MFSRKGKSSSHIQKETERKDHADEKGLSLLSIVQVDVEDKQSGVWHNLTPYDGGLSGWRLLWDRICPVPSLRFGGTVPRYNELVNTLSWIAHSQNLRRMCQDYRVDLYLRPPNIGAYKLMDFHLMDDIVKSAQMCIVTLLYCCSVVLLCPGRTIVTWYRHHSESS